MMSLRHLSDPLRRQLLWNLEFRGGVWAAERLGVVSVEKMLQASGLHGIAQGVGVTGERGPRDRQRGQPTLAPVAPPGPGRSPALLTVEPLTSPPFSLSQGRCSQMCRNIFIVESVCVGWFSLEFLLRLIQAPSKFAFLRSPLTLIDMVAILPYYVTLLVDGASAGRRKPGTGNSYLDKVGLVLRVLRALRILYVMRLARHSLGLQTLGLTARRCTREFGLLLLFLCVAIALFAPLLYVIENEMAESPEFTSIPACYWWAVITMTTVGYGDMVPRSTPGQVVALSSILSGILLMAFPVTSIFHTFSRSYLELKQEQERVMFRRTQFLIKTKSQLSSMSHDSDILFGSASSDTRDNN